MFAYLVDSLLLSPKVRILFWKLRGGFRQEYLDAAVLFVELFMIKGAVHIIIFQKQSLRISQGLLNMMIRYPSLKVL